MVFEAAEMVAPKCAGALTCGTGAGREVKTDAKEGGLLWWRWRGGAGVWLGLGLVLRENGCAGTVAEREEL